ncbi:hypothetical protein AX16_010696 [Volvariella volvacea WC 439]|nr:hypothetical protein AX16_010696 [Volvariella volvacea WC 439]
MTAPISMKFVNNLPSEGHISISPSSASASGSDYASPESRATTPELCAPTPSFSALTPSHFVVIPTSKEALTTAFQQFATDGLLGVYLGVNAPDVVAPASPGQWKEETLLSEGKSELKCMVTSTPPPECDTIQPVTCTTPGYAKHLELLSLATLRSVICFPTSDGQHLFHIIERPRFTFPPVEHEPPLCVRGFSTGANIPSAAEWQKLWAAWDLVTLGMIPKEMLHQKPIDLRHKCLFYIGHIPTFLDMLLHKSIGGGASEPAYFWNIFERGIDPHVDDPDHCHNHSEVPEKDEDWPTLDTVMAFRARVRARLMNLYNELETGKRPLTRNIARTLVMTLEHEGWHVETLLYMLIQRAGTGTLPPPGFVTPPWERLSAQWDSVLPPTTATVTLGPADLIMGQDDSEGSDSHPDTMYDIQDHMFGWDNESPARTVRVEQFKAEWRPVTNEEFLTFLEGKGKGCVDMPKSWVEENGEYKVRTMYGPVAMSIARHWPVLTSYDDLSTFAKAKGGRLPTEPELRLLLNTYDVGYEGGANTGFRNWHPVPATMGCSENAGKGTNGGVWEWTSTLFDTHDGISPTNLFTGYSTDFFDTKHQVVLGASYATIPRLGRRTVRNFWQHNYPYPWVAGRVVYDC